MPHHEPDPEDPLAFVAVELPASDDASLAAMVECLAEEYARLGYGPEAVLGLFQNPFFAGAHRALRVLGEERVRSLVERAVRPFAPRARP